MSVKTYRVMIEEIETSLFDDTYPVWYDGVEYTDFEKAKEAQHDAENRWPECLVWIETGLALM